MKKGAMDGIGRDEMVRTLKAETEILRKQREIYGLTRNEWAFLEFLKRIEEAKELMENSNVIKSIAEFLASQR